MGGFVYLYITNPTREEARKIARHLLRKKLVACANILGPATSLYPWKGKLADEEEWILIAKTTEKLAEEATKETEKIHSYTVPCVVKIPASPNKKYGEWLESLVGKGK